ncbi:hypothetical protein P152DRAFT_452346 [Eremomyces bilateralis CBS 781.70]|uniref:Uncharacterized protein n=1 Tax=Eremomyces bilateralis CBS 781.70 TaxID=1392243 RepID=A0A6G1FTM2_9PEZI|nr:uncharacterized protein P152DRAFT_452346 [Eremomyces bilateralis CBS 781.70]KAF1809032.1 hypothetical protein P152DRAFT_452346 [Eremomyces bilateralis CBS 781.70]
MAAFARHPSSDPRQSELHDTPVRHASLLPQGPCNYRDINAGPKAPACGCRRFWSNGGPQHASGSEGPSKQSQGETWCACRHHACFHDTSERSPLHKNAAGQSNPVGSPHLKPPERSPIYVQLQPSKGDGSLQLMVGSQVVSVLGLDSNRRQVSIPSTQNTGRYRTSQSNATESLYGRKDALAKDDAASRISQGSRNTSLYSEFPPIPPEYLLNSDELRPASQMGFPPNDLASERRILSSSRNIAANQGLGLMIPGALHGTPTPTVPDSPVPSTNHLSADGRTLDLGLDPALMQDAIGPTQVLPSFDVTTALPDIDWDGVIQDAADLATTGNTNTPDLTNFLQTLQEAKTVAATLSENTCQTSPPGHQTDTKAASGSQPLHSQSFQAAVKRLPSLLLQLSPLLSSLDDHIKKYPSISTSLTSLKNRVEALETTSFSVVHPEEVEEKFDQFDSRLLEIENKQDDHDRRLVSLDVEHDQQLWQRASNNGSTGSALVSFTSSAAMDAAETEEKLRDVEDRLQILETSAPPSFEAPWEIEVVFLPWGQDLRGVWAAARDFKQHTANTTQESEEWAQSRGLRSTSRISSLHEPKSSGWSSQAIQGWVEGEGELLYGKACNTSGIVYKRLRSRGLICDVVLTSPGAREVSTAIEKALGDVLIAIAGKGPFDGEAREARGQDETLGLLAKTIPLRKIHRSSRLRFLSPGEMVTSALWTAEFLASGIMMRGSGKKRLFVTHNAAYRQDKEDQAGGWTWQQLRELPRIYQNEELQNEELAQHEDEASVGHVAEADAKEACWAYHPSLDPVPSNQSSFASHASGSFSHRPNSSHNDQYSVEIDEGKSSMLYPQPERLRSSKETGMSEDVQGVFHPITPISEFPPLTTPRVLRTVSDPLAVNSHLQQPERRIASFGEAGPPTLKTSGIARPSSQLSPLKRGKAKRRRLEGALGDDFAMLDPIEPPSSPFQFAQQPDYAMPSRPSRHSRADSTGFSGAAWAPTPARSHDPGPEASDDFAYEFDDPKDLSGNPDEPAHPPVRPSTSGSVSTVPVAVLASTPGQYTRGYAPRSAVRGQTRISGSSGGNRRRSIRSITPCAYATPFSGPGGGYLRRGSGSAIGSNSGGGSINQGIAAYGGNDWAIDPSELGLMSVDDFEYEFGDDDGDDDEDDDREEQALRLSDVEGLERDEDDGDEEVWEGVAEDADTDQIEGEGEQRASPHRRR